MFRTRIRITAVIGIRIIDKTMAFRNTCDGTLKLPPLTEANSTHSMPA